MAEEKNDDLPERAADCTGRGMGKRSVSSRPRPGLSRRCIAFPIADVRSDVRPSADPDTVGVGETCKGFVWRVRVPSVGSALKVRLLSPIVSRRNPVRLAPYPDSPLWRPCESRSPDFNPNLSMCTRMGLPRIANCRLSINQNCSYHCALIDYALVAPKRVRIMWRGSVVIILLIVAR